MKDYSERIKVLTTRAKEGNDYMQVAISEKRLISKH